MGGIKDKKFKKQKTAVAKGDGLTLNADAECVEILHSKVKTQLRKVTHITTGQYTFLKEKDKEC